jgi:sulfatase modifying factor 1
LGHNTQAALSPDTALLAVANAASGRVRLWDLATGVPTHDFAGHPTQPVSVAFSRDGTRVAAGYMGAEPGEGDWNDPEHAVVRMWDSKSGTLMQEFKGHAGPVMGLEFSPDDSLLLSLACDRHNAAGDFVQSTDHSLRVWDVASGRERVRFEPQSRVNVARWTPAGAEICSGTRIWSLPPLIETEQGAAAGSSSSAAPPPAVAPFDSAAAEAHQAAWAGHLGVPVEHVNSLGMKLRLIPPGQFMMGSTPEEIDGLVRGLEQGGAADFDKFVARFSGPQHKVRITRPFYLGAHEVAVGQYRQFVEATNYIGTMEQLGVKRFQWTSSVAEPNADQRAVIGVSWDDAKAFCKWLSEKDGLTYDLPSEAQWEYACRAGTTTAWSFGDDAGGLAAHAVFGRDSFWPAEVVGSKAANPFGLFDMHGNADEWCLDWHEAGFYSQSPVDDPVCTTNPQDKNSGRVARGGTSHSAAWWTRSTTRPWDFPATPNNPKGFRVVVAGDLSRLKTEATAAPQEAAQSEAVRGDFAEIAWGNVGDGWQVGIALKFDKPHVAAGKAVEFELKIRNTTDAEKTIEIEQPDDWDLWYSGGSDLHVRILGREKRTLTLASREEKSVEVPQPQIGTDGLPRGTYKVRFTTPLGDESQQPPADVLGFELDGPEVVARTEPLKHAQPAYEAVAWGSPVLGFSFGVRSVEAEAGKQAGLEFFLWNMTTESMGTHYLEHHALDWQPVLRDADGKEYCSLPILTGPKVQTQAALGADGVLPLGAASLDRQWTTSDGPAKLPAGSYHASAQFNCQPHGVDKLHLRLTSGQAALEIKPTQ